MLHSTKRRGPCDIPVTQTHPTPSMLERPRPASGPAPAVYRSLASCAKGDEVIVVEVLPSNGREQRLLELGLVPAALVQVLQCGSTMLIDVNGARLALSRAAVSDVIVTTV